jgi:hypothetical protein
MSETYKREFVFVVAGIAAIIAILSYYFTGISQTGVADQIYKWALIIQLMAIGLGAINMVQYHYKNIQRRTKGLWYNSLWFMIFFVILLVTGLMYIASGTQPYVYNWSFTYVYTSLSSTLYAITGFYIFSAAYRAFRARNIDATLLLVAGIFVMLANAPIGEVIWSGFPTIGNWLNNSGQIPAMRTFVITGALGVLAFGFRALLGKEKGFYAGVE